MTTNFQKIKELILKSELPLADQTELIEMFAKAKDSDLENVLNLFSEDSSWIKRISENYQAKHSALISDNQTAWKNILQTEEKQLEDLEKNN